MHLILIGGGTSSGKTTIAQQISEQLANENVFTFSHDNYYKDLSDFSEEEIARVNFDHPGAIDSVQLIEDINKILNRDRVVLPSYNFITHQRSNGIEVDENVRVIILEGIFALYYPKLLELASLKVFVDTDADLRLARRISRDIEDRGFTLESVLKQYIKTVKPMHDIFIEPTKRQADIVIPGEKKFDRVLMMMNGFLKELTR